LYVKAISKYVKLPERVSIDISGCNTVEDFIRKANVIKGDYMEFVEENKSEPRNVHLHVAISNGWKVKIVKKTKRIYDFALLLSASASVTTALDREKLMGKMKEYELYTKWFAMSLYDCMKFEKARLN